MAACSGFAGAAALRVAVATACPGPQALSSRQPRLGFLIVRGANQSLPAPRLVSYARNFHKFHKSTFTDASINTWRLSVR